MLRCKTGRRELGLGLQRGAAGAWAARADCGLLPLVLDKLWLGLRLSCCAVQDIRDIHDDAVEGRERAESLRRAKDERQEQLKDKILQSKLQELLKQKQQQAKKGKKKAAAPPAAQVREPGAVE